MSAVLERAIFLRRSKRLRAMCRQLRTTRLRGMCSGHRRSTIMWLATVVAMFMTLATGAAQACSKQSLHGSVTGSVGVADGAMRVAQVTAVMVSNSAASVRGMPCCVKSDHCSSVGCASACCAGCTVAIDFVSSSIALRDAAGVYIFRTHARIVPVRPPPEFRPPRFFA